MEKRVSLIKHSKLRGEWAELRFMALAAEHGLSVSKPFGDSQRYDVTVESKGHFLRIQVKSTMARFGKGYICTFIRTGMAPYKPEDLDFFAIYVIPADVWYIIPAKVATRYAHNIMLSPQLKGHKYEPYLEAWSLLQPETPEVKPDTGNAAV
jgi:PD-(D/E)XK endonuclease